MASRIQVVFDCVDPDLLTRFWALALGYRIEDPPAGFDDWRSYWAHVGLPEDELVDSGDSIVDPDGVGPRIWCQVVPEGKVAYTSTSTLAAAARCHSMSAGNGSSPRRTAWSRPVPPAYACSNRRGSTTSAW